MNIVFRGGRNGYDDGIGSSTLELTTTRIGGALGRKWVTTF